MKSRKSSKFGHIRLRAAELAASERLKKTYTYNGKNVVTTLTASILIESSSFLQVMRTSKKTWMSSNFGKIPPPTPELSALEHL